MRIKPLQAEMCQSMRLTESARLLWVLFFGFVSRFFCRAQMRNDEGYGQKVREWRRRREKTTPTQQHITDYSTLALFTNNLISAALILPLYFTPWQNASEDRERESKREFSSFTQRATNNATTDRLQNGFNADESGNHCSPYTRFIASAQQYRGRA